MRESQYEIGKIHVEIFGNEKNRMNVSYQNRADACWPMENLFVRVLFCAAAQLCVAFNRSSAIDENVLLSFCFGAGQTLNCNHGDGAVCGERGRDGGIENGQMTKIRESIE